jgi:hypothetical protein
MIKWIAVVCLMISVCIVLPLQYQSENNFSARCVKVFDCKRIIVWIENQWFCNRMKIRLDGIQCPNRTTIPGKQAHMYVKHRIYGKMIDIEIVKRRFWGWSDAIIYCNGVCLNSAMKTKWK